MESGGDFSQGVSAGSRGGRKKGPESLRGLLLLQVPGPHLLTDAGFQQAIGRNGAVPQQSVKTGLHWKHHPLKGGQKPSPTAAAFVVPLLQQLRDVLSRVQGNMLTWNSPPCS